MWGEDRNKKRKVSSEPAVPKSWKGRVLLQNKTVKKSETSTRKVVWFSGTDCEELQTQKVDLTGRVVCPDPIKARQCLDFELHFKIHTPFPADVKLMVFAVLYKSDSGEEIKEGVVNNFSYLQCSQSHGVAVFQKLYLETRSQFSHFLEFTLWAERPPPAGNPDLVRQCYDGETYYPIPGTNTYRTPHFIPSTPSKKVVPPPEVELETERSAIEFIKMVPNKGEANSTIYLTFATKSREPSGEIFVVWNDEILHLPYYTKGGHERIVVIDKIPASNVESVPVYLKEKPAQDSRAVGFSSGVLYFHYTVINPNYNSSPQVDQAQFLPSRAPGIFSSSLNHSGSSKSSASSEWSDGGPTNRGRSISAGPVMTSRPQPNFQQPYQQQFNQNQNPNQPTQIKQEDIETNMDEDNFSNPASLYNLRISSPPTGRANSSFSDSGDGSDMSQWHDHSPADADAVPNYQSFKQIHHSPQTIPPNQHPNAQMMNFNPQMPPIPELQTQHMYTSQPLSHSPRALLQSEQGQGQMFGQQMYQSHSTGHSPQIYTSHSNPVSPRTLLPSERGMYQPQSQPHSPQTMFSSTSQPHSPQSHSPRSRLQSEQQLHMQHLEMQNQLHAQLQHHQQTVNFQNHMNHGDPNRNYRLPDQPPAQGFQQKFFQNGQQPPQQEHTFSNATQWGAPQHQFFDPNSKGDRYDFSLGSTDKNIRQTGTNGPTHSNPVTLTRSGRLPPTSNNKKRNRSRHLSLPSQTEMNHYFQNSNFLHQIEEEKEPFNRPSKTSSEDYDLTRDSSSHIIDSFFVDDDN